DSKYLLRDLRSLNGTYILGERIAEHILKDGDEVTMGSTKLLLVESQEETSRHRVTISPKMTESHIRQRMQAESGDFLPERAISDEASLRRDYERLRIAHDLARYVGSEL